MRQAEVALAEGKSTAQACRALGVTDQTYYRWRREYGGMRVDQLKRLKELEKENARREWLGAADVKTLDIAPGSPSENGYVESFNGRFRDEFPNGEIFYTLKEAKVLIERW